MRLEVQHDVNKAAQKIKTLKLIPFKPRRIARGVLYINALIVIEKWRKFPNLDLSPDART